MDFLSILNASLPEGKMDYLSTLEVSASSLPPGADSMPTGLDLPHAKVDRMAQIREFPGESEHGTLARMESRKISAFSNTFNAATQGHTPQPLRGQGLSDSIRDTSAPSSTKREAESIDVDALTPASASQMVRRSKAPSPALKFTGRRSSAEISPKTSSYMGVKPRKVKSCLQCGKNEREVMMLPCSHVCLCQVCAMLFHSQNR